MQLTERYATESDKLWLWEIYRELLKPCIDAQWGWDEEFQRNLFKTDLPLKDFVIYSKAGVDVGVSLINTEADHYYVKMLLIVGEFQGRGIGRFIMERLKATAECQDRAIRLSVIKANDVVGFYEKLGFISVDESDGSIKYQYTPYRSLSGNKQKMG